MKEIYYYFDEENGEVFFDGISSVIYNKTAPARYFKELRKIIGPVAKRMVYNIEKKIAEKWLYSPEGNNKDALSELLNKLCERGYGICKLVKFDDNTISVMVKNSCGVSLFRNEEEPVCHGVAGTLAGIGEVVFKEGMECVERKCVAKGDEFCEFEISKNNKPPSYQPLKSEIDNKKLAKHSLLLNENTGEIFFKNAASFIYPRSQDAEYVLQLKKIIGPSAYRILYIVGKAGAHTVLSEMQKYTIRVLSSFAKKKVASILLREQVLCRGFGIPELVEFDEIRRFICVRMRNCNNSIGLKKMNESVCYVMAGIFAGGCEIIFNRRMGCVERKCVAKGDEFCEFIISPEVKGL